MISWSNLNRCCLHIDSVKNMIFAKRGVKLPLETIFSWRKKTNIEIQDAPQNFWMSKTISSYWLKKQQNIPSSAPATFWTFLPGNQKFLSRLIVFNTNTTSSYQALEYFQQAVYRWRQQNFGKTEPICSHDFLKQNLQAQNCSHFHFRSFLCQVCFKKPSREYSITT